MWMLTTALYGSRLQGQECKRKTAVLAPPGVILHTFVELVHSILDLHCAQSILTHRGDRPEKALFGPVGAFGPSPRLLSPRLDFHEYFFKVCALFARMGSDKERQGGKS